jgi:hypothetical protein
MTGNFLLSRSFRRAGAPAAPGGASRRLARVSSAAVLAAFVLLGPVDALAADISLAWDASPGTVAGYRVYYGTSPNPHLTGTSITVGNQTTAIVSNLSNGVTYYFRVTAYSGTLESLPSNEVSGLAGSALSFTDDPLLPGVHMMKAVHLSELRSRIDALRKTRGLAGMSWLPMASGSVVSATHLMQLRSALDAVYTAAGLQQPSYTDAPLTTGTSIKATHITQLRTFVKALE